jgi:hypothetical protein
MATHMTSSYPPGMFMAGSYWISHQYLDTFDSDRLIEALVASEEIGRPFLWTSDLQPYFEAFKRHCGTIQPPRGASRPEVFFRFDDHGREVEKMVRQAEALFNLSQLMFALYHGQHKTSTFGDLNNPQLNNPEVNPNRVVPVRDISEHGFNKIADQEKGSGTACRRALHDLCCDIFEAAGLEVIFSMFKHDHMKIIKQKCLDALTNILCVPVIEEYVLRQQSWFLRETINLIRCGKTDEKLQQDVVPSISVLDRLIGLV